MHTGRWFVVLALLVLCIGGLGTTREAAASCGPYAPVYTFNNNFSIVDGTNKTTGGGNDILFTWDGTLKTSVAVSGQVANASVSSYTNCLTGTGGTKWTAHDATVYGPGTYTVYASCPPRSPGCATGTNPITFTVGASEIGVHMLVDWGTVSINKNIDVVNVWQQKTVFGPSSMYTGACGAGNAAQVWDLMSKDPTGSGINGYPMVDGPFIGNRWNFNILGPPLTRTIQTSNNNFTMIDSTGATFGGTNDVCFSWDGTQMRSVAVSGQVSNASLSSSCAFFGHTWAAHDMAIYGPGTYTIYDGCAAGSPGCGIGNPVTFSVNSGELGVHMLFNWNGSDNIDVVDVWQPKSVFAPSIMCDNTSAGFIYGCSTNLLSTVWDWMSYNWTVIGINGGPMTDGPFLGSYANFNVMGKIVCLSDAECNDGNACTTDVCDVQTGDCQNTPIVCNDDNACTIDSCDPATGNCVFTPRVCNDNNACTADSCNPANGCVYTPIIVCNDNNPCTADTCDPVTGGCVFTPKTCNDGNACTTDTCDPATGCVHTPIICDDNNVCTADSCNPAIGCVYTPIIVCNDNNPCTADTCDPITGNCVFTPIPVCNGSGLYVPVFTKNNNLSIIDATGAVTGGANDIWFTWDGTLKTSVAISGQVSNATIGPYSSFVQAKCFTGTGGTTWKAHDVAVYGPGTYTVYASCAAKAPGCTTGTNPITFTVGAGEIGVHMLVDWGTLAADRNIDAVNVWKLNSVFSPSPMWTGACGSNNASKVWDLMSKDPGTGINGYPMVDGPFVGTRWNFNLMGPAITRIIDTSHNNFTMIDGTGATFGGTNDVRFTWDGTQKTSVVVSGQVSNASLSSPCNFFANTWAAHDMAIYGPGTYTIFDGCPAGSPGCGTGTPVTFTVNPGERGVHMLFYWNGSDDIDVVDVWQPNAVFGPSVMCDGTTAGFLYGCGTNPLSTVWDWMSYDWTGYGINGAPMTEGPFDGIYANFNVMGMQPLVCTFNGQCNDNNACTADSCVNNECVNTPIAGCCNTAADCNDNNICTADTCVGNACVHTTIDCNDNNACTIDTCAPAVGCVHTPISCNDNNACTIDTCDPATGNCMFTPRVCNDNNACTIDTCDPAVGCVYTPKVVCNDNNACTTDTCDPASGNCVFTPRVCNDGNSCTADTCDSATGICVFTPIAGCNHGSAYVPIFSTNNNLSITDATNKTASGGNDIWFTWDGTLKTSVAASLQVSNATIASYGAGCFTGTGGTKWVAHDVAVYGPGTYTVKASCPARSPGCSTGTSPITFTVGANEIGVHMLVDWGTLSTNKNIDVVNVWQQKAVFNPSPMWTGACGSGNATQIWDLMSKPNPATPTINGYAMVDGPFIGTRWNFNMTGAPIYRIVDTSNNNFTMIDGTGQTFGGTNDVRFTWDNTQLTSVAASGQVSNASLSSPCAFFAYPWFAHDVAVYGPGTYTVFDGCAAGSPGCGVGNPVTFNVNPGELGVHMLFDWNRNDNIDVVNVWQSDKVFLPSVLCDNTTAGLVYGCGTGSLCTAWDHMSYDWNGDGINGAPMTEGPFDGTYANFNVNGIVIPSTWIDTNNNNFTMIDGTGATFGGTNDVRFSWAGTQKTSVATCGQVSNAKLSSPCKFFGHPWAAHDVAIYGPGTYTVFDGCIAGAPGCGTGNPITFTVNPGELGVHMLFNWNGIDNIDVVDVWQPGVFGPSVMCDGTTAGFLYGCGTNPLSTYWDHMSYDWNRDGINGAPMTDGPFVGSYANFNWRGSLCGGCVPADCNDNNACTTDTCACSGCVHTPIDCNDNNACTADSCDPATGCVHTAISCNDNNACTVDSCDPATGCVHTARNCDDGNCETIDSCNPATGCIHTQIDCSDNNACTVDMVDCVNKTCIHVPINCNDNNACTNDSCNPATGCVYTPNCLPFDQDPCAPIVCTNPAVGCVPNPIVCNDNNACTNDSCNPATGCVFTAINCDDNNICTADSCDTAKGCVHTPIVPASCNDNNACTIDGCSNNACMHTAIMTDDNDICTVDTCDPVTGVVVHTHIVPASCNDNNACTIDGCTNNACTHTMINCDDNNICTVESCDIKLGCVHTPTVPPQCNDNNPCTQDGCFANVCTHVAKCPLGWFCDPEGNCLPPNICDDNNPCTIDAINPAVGCIHIPVDCNDHNSCTNDSCDPATGACVYTTNNAICTPPPAYSNFTMLDPGNNHAGGTNDVMFAWDGTKRTSVAVSGQVSNALITSSCPFFGVPWSAHDVTVYGPGTYCVYTDCPAGSPGCGLGAPICFTVKTGEIGIHMLFDWNGSKNIDVVNVMKPNAVSPSLWTGACGSNSACTVWAWSSYDPDGDGIPGFSMVDGPFQGMSANFNLIKISVDLCCDAATRCNDNNACTVDTCISATGACVHTAISCDDNNACSVDSCDTVIGCVHTPVNCDDNNACTVDTCDTVKGCQRTPVNCDDNNACTVESCDPAMGCVHSPVTTDDHNACTVDTCNPVTGTVHTPINCDDNNICTADSCDPTTGCVHTPIVPASCNDNNACTTDGCTNNACTHAAISCDDSDICTADSCNPATGCVHTPIVPASCNDNDACTIDGCTANACTHTALSCDDSNACTADSCNPATGCVHTAISCDDNNACTTDTCVPATGCVHTPVVCNDNNACTTDTCDPAIGCVFTPTNCDCPGPITTVILIGGGGNSNTVDKQIQTSFTGCIVSYTKSSVTALVGRTLQYNVTVGVGPQPSTCTFNGAAVPCGTNQITPTTAGTVGKLVLDNKANGGSDTDRITISAQ